MDLRGPAPALLSTSEAMSALHNVVGLSYHDVARVLGISNETVRRLRTTSEDVGISPRRIRVITNLLALLDTVFADSAARRQWLLSPSRMLGGREPLALLRAGRVMPVVSALATLESGAFI